MIDHGVRQEENHGVLPRPRAAKDFISGWITTLPQEPMNPTGNWRPYLPTYEPQSALTFDTMGCVSFAALNLLETMLKYSYGEEKNWSDRFLAKMSGTTKRGNWFNAVWDSLRKNGVVDEHLWPFEGKTWEKYYSAIPEELKAKGLSFTSKYDIGYEFLPFINDEYLKQGLKRSPLQIAIGTDQNPSYHSIILVDIDDDGNRWVFDHYPRTEGEEVMKGLYIMPDHLNINAALIGYIAKVKDKPMPNITLPNDTLVTGVLDHGLVQALHIDGKLLLDPNDKDQSMRQWFARNEDNGFFKGGPVRTISKEDWDSFPLNDFKGNAL